MPLVKNSHTVVRKANFLKLELVHCVALFDDISKLILFHHIYEGHQNCIISDMHIHVSCLVVTNDMQYLFTSISFIMCYFSFSD